MIEEQAQVIAIESDFITVEGIVKSTCSGCQQLDSCGSGQIAKAFPHKKTTYLISSDKPVKIGDRVLIGLSEKVLLSAAWQVYMWPLIGLFIGSLLGQFLVEQQIISHELFALLIGILGGGLGFYLARRQQSKLLNMPQWSPILLKIIN